MKYLICAVLFLSLFIGCEDAPPVDVDGTASLELVAQWVPNDTTGVVEPLSNAKVILVSEYGIQIKQTDQNGIFKVNNLPYAKYTVSVRMQHPLDPNIVVVGTIKDIDLISNCYSCDTIMAKKFSSFGVSINEVYSAGPINSMFFFYDQYLELYNSSDSVRYLDGMVVSRVSGNSSSEGNKGPGADEGDDGDIDGFTYMFKFPGNYGEKNYPIYPKQYLVLACDAINHTSVVGTSIDLSNADWEFFNQFSADDVDNPKVPNLINIRSDRTTDFLINLSSDIIVLSDGRDLDWTDGIDISNIIDGVEYQQTLSSEKTLDSKIDRGFALAPAKYSGQSIQRREPGGDSNDGSIDWEIMTKPTPGYQK
ncbi:MAG: DUF4876 domain-containing protein [Syntrophothermus sp.]